MVMAVPCGVFLELMAQWLGCLPWETSTRSSSAWGSSSVRFPREQPNKQASCGRGRNSELVVEAGSWRNKLYMTQRARKGATRGSAAAARWLQQTWEGNKAWHTPGSTAVSPSEPMQKTVQHQMWRLPFLEDNINLSPQGLAPSCPSAFLQHPYFSVSAIYMFEPAQVMDGTNDNYFLSKWLSQQDII